MSSKYIAKINPLFLKKEITGLISLVKINGASDKPQGKHWNS